MATSQRVYFTRNISGYIDVPTNHTPSRIKELIKNSIKLIGITPNKDEVFLHKIHVVKNKCSI